MKIETTKITVLALLLCSSQLSFAQSDPVAIARQAAVINQLNAELSAEEKSRGCVDASATDPTIPSSFFPSAYQVEKPFVSDRTGAMTFCLWAPPVDKSLNYCTNEKEFHEFQVQNNGSPRMNPTGDSGTFRQFIFSAEQSARQEAFVTVYDRGIAMGGNAKDSAWDMTTRLVFLPRKVQPAIRSIKNGAAYEVTIPDGEKLVFDAKTKELVDGPLRETSAVDTNTDRNARKFAGLSYNGKGIMLRSDQRGDDPRSQYVFGGHTEGAPVTAVWGGKTCKLARQDIWAQDSEGATGTLFATDDGFYNMLQKKCGWHVSAADFE